MTSFDPRTPTPYRPTKAHKAIVAGFALFIAYLTAAFGDDVFDWGEAGEGVALLVELLGGTFAVFLKGNPPVDN